MNSLNHIMFGSIDEFFYKDIAGIRSQAPGFKKILIQPHVLGDMKYASASVKTIRGTVASKWNKDGNSITLEVTIPGNSTAVIDIPKTDLNAPYLLTEGGQAIWSSHGSQNNDAGITKVSDVGNYVEVSVGSGKYEFNLSGQPTN